MEGIFITENGGAEGVMVFGRNTGCTVDDKLISLNFFLNNFLRKMPNIPDSASFSDMRIYLISFISL